MPKRVRRRLPSISIVIPAYNEEKNIRFVLKNILTNAPKFFSDFEIIVIDDGSSDKTGKIADEFAKKHKQVRVFHTKNRGYANAMLAGIKQAKKDFIAYMPADGQFLLQDMQYCLPLMKDADLILGARGSRADYSTLRLIYSYSYLILLRILYGITFQDVNWLHIWKTKELKKIKIRSRGIFMLAEVVIRFQKKGLKVVEGHSYYRPRKSGEAKNGKITIAAKTFIDAVFLWFII